MTDRLLQLSVNINLIDKYRPEEASHFAHGFVPKNFTIEDLEELVRAGICFSYQYKNQHRKTENFLRSSFLAVDMDGGRSIAECLNDPIVKNYCSLFYTTPSHTSDHHRFRLVFSLPRTLTRVAELKSATRALALRLGGDLTATDGARMFYGSSMCRSELLGNEISDGFLNELILAGNDNPVSDSILNKPTTSNSDKPLDLNLEVKKVDGSLMPIKAIKDKSRVYCPFHHDKRPRAFISTSFKYGTKYLVCYKCKTIWREHNPRFAKFDFDGFENHIRQIKTEGIPKEKDEFAPLDEFMDDFYISTKNIHISNDQFLTLSKIEEGLTLIKSPKGTGKTTYLAKVLNSVIEKFPDFKDFEKAADIDPNVQTTGDEKILLIGHRQALIGDLCKRLGLNSYLDDLKFKSQEQTHRKSRYGICLDSLWKIDHQTYDIIVIDEVEQVLGHFLSETIGSRREATFHIFTNLLRKAKRIVVLDADLSWITFNTLYSLLTDRESEAPLRSSKSIAKPTPFPVHIYINEWKQKGREINMFPSDIQLIQHIKSSVLDGKRIFVASNSKKKIKVLDKAIGKLAKDAGIDIRCIAITSENSGSKDVQKFIKNIKSEILKYDVIMSSPSLGTGIDITFDNSGQEIDCVYGLFENRINSHFEIDQQLARVRHPKEVNVWISKARYNFATDITVVADDCLKQDLIGSIGKGLVFSSIYEQSGMPPFLKMAALIVATHRASKNNLKNNFINYKKALEWKVIHEKFDGDKSAEGDVFYFSMRDVVDQEMIDNIENATTLNEVQYKKFKERIEKFNESAEPQEWYNFLKTLIELFYGVPAHTGIIGLDKRGQYRKKVSRYESLLVKSELTKDDWADQSTPKSKKLQKTKLELIPDYRLGSALLYELLSLTPIFQDGKFDASVVFSTNDLYQFAVESMRLRKLVQGQLDVSTRLDVDRKPVQHLGKLLELVGLDTESAGNAKKGKIKTYSYKLDLSELDKMKYVTDQRAFYEPKSKNIGWPYVNKLHNFDYSEEEMDWIYRH